VDFPTTVAQKMLTCELCSQHISKGLIACSHCNLILHKKCRARCDIPCANTVHQVCSPDGMLCLYQHRARQLLAATYLQPLGIPASLISTQLAYVDQGPTWSLKPMV
jgi:hypothetical protein